MWRTMIEREPRDPKQVEELKRELEEKKWEKERGKINPDLPDIQTPIQVIRKDE